MDIHERDIQKMKENHRKLAEKQLRVNDWERYAHLMLNDIEVEYEDLMA